MHTVRRTGIVGDAGTSSVCATDGDQYEKNQYCLKEACDDVRSEHMQARWGGDNK